MLFTSPVGERLVAEGQKLLSYDLDGDDEYFFGEGDLTKRWIWEVY